MVAQAALIVGCSALAGMTYMQSSVNKSHRSVASSYKLRDFEEKPAHERGASKASEEQQLK